MRTPNAALIDAVQRAADQMKDIVDRPALRWLREEHERMQAFTANLGSLPEMMANSPRSGAGSR